MKFTNYAEKYLHYCQIREAKQKEAIRELIAADVLPDVASVIYKNHKELSDVCKYINTKTDELELSLKSRIFQGIEYILNRPLDENRTYKVFYDDGWNVTAPFVEFTGVKTICELGEKWVQFCQEKDIAVCSIMRYEPVPFTEEDVFSGKADSADYIAEIFASKKDYPFGQDANITVFTLPDGKKGVRIWTNAADTIVEVFPGVYDSEELSVIRHVVETADSEKPENAKVVTLMFDDTMDISDGFTEVDKNGNYACDYITFPYEGDGRRIYIRNR